MAMNSSLTYLVNLISYRRDSIVFDWLLDFFARKPHGWLIPGARGTGRGQGPQSGMQNSCKDAPRSWLAGPPKQRQPPEQDLDLYVDLKATGLWDRNRKLANAAIAMNTATGTKRRRRLHRTKSW